jgi:hypothetical protein
VTTKRRKLIAIVLLAVIGGVIAYSLLRQDDEPTYQGRRLSEWLDPNHRDAKTGVQRIGTNALPPLLKWIDYEKPPEWRVTIYQMLRYPRSHFAHKRRGIFHETMTGIDKQHFLTKATPTERRDYLFDFVEESIDRVDWSPDSRQRVKDIFRQWRATLPTEARNDKPTA